MKLSWILFWIVLGTVALGTLIGIHIHSDNKAKQACIAVGLVDTYHYHRDSDPPASCPPKQQFKIESNSAILGHYEYSCKCK